jgi:hypothetical protein
VDGELFLMVGEVQGKGRKARGEHIGTVRSSHFAGQGILNLPGILNDNEHVPLSNDGSQPFRPRFDAGKRVSLRTKERSPAALYIQQVRLWTHPGPQQAIRLCCKNKTHQIR